MGFWISTTAPSEILRKVVYPLRRCMRRRALNSARTIVWSRCYLVSTARTVIFGDVGESPDSYIQKARRGSEHVSVVVVGIKGPGSSEISLECIQLCAVLGILSGGQIESDHVPALLASPIVRLLVAARSWCRHGE